MLYKDGRKYRRRIGQARKSQSIYDNLGHPYEIKGKSVRFMGKNPAAYSLTSGKVYDIIKADTLKKGNWDEGLRKRKNNMKKGDKRVEYDQSEDYFITIINDKGHKRQYSHLMFESIACKT